MPETEQKNGQMQNCWKTIRFCTRPQTRSLIVDRGNTLQKEDRTTVSNYKNQSENAWHTPFLASTLGKEGVEGEEGEEGEG